MFIYLTAWINNYLDAVVKTHKNENLIQQMFPKSSEDPKTQRKYPFPQEESNLDWRFEKQLWKKLWHQCRKTSVPVQESYGTNAGELRHQCRRTTAPVQGSYSTNAGELQEEHRLLLGPLETIKRKKENFVEILH